MGNVAVRDSSRDTIGGFGKEEEDGEDEDEEGRVEASPLPSAQEAMLTTTQQTINAERAKCVA